MNILYIGSSSPLSVIPFKQLLQSEHNVVAVGIFSPLLFDNKIIAFASASSECESMSLIANQFSIPEIDLSKSIDSVRYQCEGFFIDVILMSCYSKRLSQEIINLASKGCFNMHPSLLPKYRGAEPVFWQMKDAADMGVSWHYVEEDSAAALDSGAIVAQQKVFLDDGMSHTEIDSVLAQNGADLMIQFLTELSNNELVSKVQDNALVSYQPYPCKKDFEIEVTWSAQQAYNFMKATESFGYPYLCKIGSYIYQLDKALDYNNNDSLSEAEVKAGKLYIPCNEGVLIASFTGKL